MIEVVREFRVGRPQVYAGLMLLGFMAQCLWTADTRKLSDLEYRYIAAGLPGAGRKAPELFSVHQPGGGFPCTLHFSGKKDRHAEIKRSACGSSALAAAAAVRDFRGMAGRSAVVGGAPAF